MSIVLNQTCVWCVLEMPITWHTQRDTICFILKEHEIGMVIHFTHLHQQHTLYSVSAKAGYSVSASPGF